MKDLHEVDTNKEKDLSKQFDKLFGSLNLGGKKKNDKKAEVELEEQTKDAGDVPNNSPKEAINDVSESSWGFELPEEPSTHSVDETDEEEKVNIDSIFKIETEETDNNKDTAINLDEELNFNFDDLYDKSFNHEVEELKTTEEDLNFMNEVGSEELLSSVTNINDSADTRKKHLSYEGLLDPELKAEVEKMQREGYEGHTFNIDGNVNSKTIPVVEKGVEDLESGKIDYNKIVGENQLMNIESIYSCNDLIKQMAETVFMIEVYSRTLPENLPKEVKRQSVLNIIKASSIEIDDLLSDAYKRIDVLNEVLEDVAQKSEEMNVSNQTEIKELEDKINELKLKIQSRADFKKSQNAMIGYEIQRIVNIVEFIEPE